MKAIEWWPVGSRILLVVLSLGNLGLVIANQNWTAIIPWVLVIHYQARDMWVEIKRSPLRNLLILELAGEDTIAVNAVVNPDKDTSICARPGQSGFFAKCWIGKWP